MMSLLASIRRRQVPWVRGATAVFAVCWLSLALQPCVMAFDAGDGDPCPYCPPTQTHHEQPCDVSHDEQCSYLDSYDCDARVLQIETKERAAAPLIGLLPAPIAVAQGADSPGFALQFDERSRSTSDPPLNLRYCVFLN